MQKGKWDIERVACQTNFCTKWHKAAATYQRHALHVQLNEVSLVVLQDGQAHTEDNLKALQTRYMLLNEVHKISKSNIHSNL